MAFPDKENSYDSGQPMELYDFEVGTTHWRYTDYTRELTHLLVTWQPEIISRTNIVNHNALTEMVRTTYQITLPESNSFANRFSLCPIDDDVKVTVYKGHSETDFIIIHVGYVIGISFNNENAILTVASKLSKLTRTSATVRFQKLCPLPLYRNRCGVPKASFTVTGTLTSASGLVLKSAAFATKADDWFTNGWIECNGYSRWILSHVADTITIANTIPGVASGMSFSAVAGCKKSISVCHSKFNRKLHYGGHRFIPTKNPLDGSNPVM